MADYLITWVDYAQDQYLALDQEVSRHLDERLRQLARHPTGEARYDRATDHWTVEFNKHGLVIFIVNDAHRRIVILRILHLT